MVLHVNPTFSIPFILCTICTCNASASRKFAYTARTVRTNNKKYCKSKVYMKHQLNGRLKNIMVFSAGAGKRRLRVDRRLKRRKKISVFKNIRRRARVDGDYAFLDIFKQITVFANPSTELVPLYGRSIRIRDKRFLEYSYLFMTTLLRDFGSPVAFDSTCLK